MSDERSQAATAGRGPRSTTTRPSSDPQPELGPVTSIHDPRVLQILSTEHWSLLSARSLAYNEAFTRGGMFLTFLSMSFVALALLVPAIGTGRDFLLAATLILAFDVVVGLTTYARIIRANHEDLLAVHGMARIRHTYTQIAPMVRPIFTSSVHDDLRGLMVSYGNPPASGVGVILYGLSTSGGMISLIVATIGGFLAMAVSLLAGVSVAVALVVAVVVDLAALAGLMTWIQRYFARAELELESLYPTPEAPAVGEADARGT